MPYNGCLLLQPLSCVWPALCLYKQLVSYYDTCVYEMFWYIFSILCRKKSSKSWKIHGIVLAEKIHGIVLAEKIHGIFLAEKIHGIVLAEQIHGIFLARKIRETISRQLAVGQVLTRHNCISLLYLYVVHCTVRRKEIILHCKLCFHTYTVESYRSWPYRRGQECDGRGEEGLFPDLSRLPSQCAGGRGWSITSINCPALRQQVHSSQEYPAPPRFNKPGNQAQR